MKVYGTRTLKATRAEMPWDCLDDPRDPLPREACGMCLRHWMQCSCDPDDPEMHRRIAVERALRAGDDITAQALMEADDV